MELLNLISGIFLLILAVCEFYSRNNKTQKLLSKI